MALASEIAARRDAGDCELTCSIRAQQLFAVLVRFASRHYLSLYSLDVVPDRAYSAVWLCYIMGPAQSVGFIKQ